MTDVQKEPIFWADLFIQNAKTSRTSKDRINNYEHAYSQYEDAIKYGDNNHEIEKKQTEILVILLNMYQRKKDKLNEKPLKGIELDDSEKDELNYIENRLKVLYDDNKITIKVKNGKVRYRINKNYHIYPKSSPGNKDTEEKTINKSATFSFQSVWNKIPKQVVFIILNVIIVIGMLSYVHAHKISPKQCALDLHLDPNKLESKLVQSILEIK